MVKRHIREANRTTKGDLTKKNKTVAKMIAKYCEGGHGRKPAIDSFRTMKDVNNMFAEIRENEKFTAGTTRELNRVEKIANDKNRDYGFKAVIEYLYAYYLNSAELGVYGSRRYNESTRRPVRRVREAEDDRVPVKFTTVEVDGTRYWMAGGTEYFDHTTTRRVTPEDTFGKVKAVIAELKKAGDLVDDYTMEAIEELEALKLPADDFVEEAFNIFDDQDFTDGPALYSIDGVWTTSVDMDEEDFEEYDDDDDEDEEEFEESRRPSRYHLRESQRPSLKNWRNL